MASKALVPSASFPGLCPPHPPTGPPQLPELITLFSTSGPLGSLGPLPGTPFPHIQLGWVLLLQVSAEMLLPGDGLTAPPAPPRAKVGPCCFHSGQLLSFSISFSLLGICLFVYCLSLAACDNVRATAWCLGCLPLRPAAVLTSCVTLGKSLPLSVSQFPCV